MSTAIAVPGNTADAFLVHFFGGGLADERYVVARFKAHADGDIHPLARRGAGEGQGPAGEARHRHAQGGEGDAPRLHRDHHLHGTSHPRRSTALGEES